jgi:hypothetical protein
LWRLVPELWQDSDQQELLKSCYDVLFGEELAGGTDEVNWPDATEDVSVLVRSQISWARIRSLQCGCGFGLWALVVSAG